MVLAGMVDAADTSPIAGIQNGWAYAIPAHGFFNILIDIWSGGCNPELYYALPVLFAYEISSFLLSIGVCRRAHYCFLTEEKAEKEFQDGIMTALEAREKELSPPERIRTEDGAEEEASDLAGPA